MTTSLRRRSKQLGAGSALKLVAVFVGTAAAVVGCTADRINHFHDSDNFEAAQQVSIVFDAARSESEGLPAKLRANIAAQQSLRQAVEAATTNALDHAALLEFTGTATWDSLVRRMRREFGAIDPQPKNGRNDVNDIAQRMNARLNMLTLVLKTYEVLVKGERVRLAALQATTTTATPRDAASVGTAAPAGAPATSPASFDQALDLLFALRKSIVFHWENDKEITVALARATDLQRRLVAMAEQSRDPASVYSLVPLLGEGLDVTNTELLAQYISGLTKGLEELDDDGCSTGGVRPSIAVGQPSDDPINSFLTALHELRGLGANPQGNPGATPLKGLEDTLAAVIDASELLSLDLDLFNRRRSGSQTAASGQTKESDSRPPTDAVTAFLGQVVGSGPDALTKAGLDGVLTPERAAKIRGVLSDIAAQDADAARWVADLVSSMQSLQEDLIDENVRHYLALSGVAKAEVERWSTLQRLSQEFASNYGDPELMFLPLSKDTPDSAFWPEVRRDSNMLASLRALAVAAHDAHMSNSLPWAAEIAVDPWPNQAAERLARALRTIQCFQLLTALDGRFAAENSIALLGELANHSVQLDHIVTSSTELEIRYQLDRIVAFHATGITNADIQAMIDLAQAGLLAWIGDRQ